MNTTIPNIRTFACVVLATAAVLCGGPVFSGDARMEVRIGLISAKPEKMLKKYTPLAGHLAKRLGQHGITTGRVVVARDLDAMREKIYRGEVDLVFESAFSTVRMESLGMTPSLLVWRKGVREYHAVFFTRRDGPVRTLQDLQGRTIVFEDRQSTSAYALPLAELRRNGVAVAAMDRDDGRRDAVRYDFAGEELNQVYWVLQRRADAGVFNNNDWDDVPPKLRRQLRVIHETRPVLRYVVSFHPQVTPELRATIEDALLALNDTAEGRSALESASESKKIERLSEADRASLEYVREISRYAD